MSYGQNGPDSSDFIPQFRHGHKYILKTTSGSTYTGFVFDETKDNVTLENRTTHERTELKKNAIISSVSSSDKQTFTDLVLGENYHARNYLFSESAFLFSKGCLNTTSHWLFLENIDYAITDNWAVSLNTLAFYPYTIGIKCAFEISDLNYIGANAFGVANLSAGNGGSLLWGYGAFAKFTRGTSNNNFTISGGVLGINSEFFYTSYTNPFVNMAFVSGAYCNRLNKNVALNFEGWYLPVIEAGVAGVGVKLVGNETTCWSFGCFTILNTYDNTVKLNIKTLPIPYIGISRRLGKS